MVSPSAHAYAGLSDIGRIRTHNEDAVLLSPPLFAVADGLGGHHAGEIASSIAIEALLAHMPGRVDAKALGRAVRVANKAVIEAAEAGEGRSGMGTTLTAAMIEGTSISIAHVGDSRAYLYHNTILERITQDHSMVADLVRQGLLTEEQSRHHPNRSIITRALGSDPNMYADVYEVDAHPGDRLLLCTDGLSGMLTDVVIADILSLYPDPEAAVKALIDAANAAGGQDNISLVVVDVTGGTSATSGKRGAPRGTGLAGVFVWMVAFLALLGVTAFGMWRYADAQAYLISEEDRVVLYRGLPEDVLGVSLRWREQETTITPRALGPVLAARLAQGIPVEDVNAGRTVLDEYQQMIAESLEATPQPEVLTPQ